MTVGGQPMPPRRRRPGAWAAGIAAVAALAFAAALWWPRSTEAPPDAVPSPGTRTDAEAEALAQRMAQHVAEREPVPPAAGREPTAPPPDGGSRLRLVDEASGDPVAAARVVELTAGEVAATTGADGIAVVPRLPLSRFALVADGWLLRVPQPGDDDVAAAAQALEEDGTGVLRLRRDEFTLAPRLRFVYRGGRVLAEPVRFTLTCLDDPPPSGASFPTARLAPGEPVLPELLQQWQRHAALAGLPRLAEHLPPLQLGVLNQDQVHLLPRGEGTVRFVAAGNYRVAAVAEGSGLVARQALRIAGGAGPLDVTMQPGHSFAGRIVGADDAPVGNARVFAQLDGWPAAAIVDSAPDGSFTLGPLLTDQVTVEVRHPSHQPQSATLRAATPQTIPLVPLATRAVSGIVRARPSGAPVAGARVGLSQLGRPLMATETAADGRFALSAPADPTVQLRVDAEGFLPFVEVLGEELQPSYVCDLLQATREQRVAAGVTAVVAGTVLDAAGAPVAGLPVQLLSEQPRAPQGLPGRMILHGQVLDLRPLALTADDGTFAIEWDVPGPARVVAVDGTSGIEDGVPVSVVLGRSTEGVRVTATPRR